MKRIKLYTLCAFLMAGAAAQDTSHAAHRHAPATEKSGGLLHPPLLTTVHDNLNVPLTETHQPKIQHGELQQQIAGNIEKTDGSLNRWSKYINPYFSLIIVPVIMVEVLLVISVTVIYCKLQKFRNESLHAYTGKPLQKQSVFKPTATMHELTNSLKTGLAKKTSTIPWEISSADEKAKPDYTWIIVGASLIGKSHITNHTPCQDNHHWESWDNHWGIALVCDGAGSAENSQKGSCFIAKEAAPDIFKQAFDTNKWQDKNELPSETEWQKTVKKCVQELQTRLQTFAKTNQVKTGSVACTLIVVIYSPLGLLVAHVGDGRAGFCNEHQEWKAIIKPHKGEEANQTIFLSSELHLSNPGFEMSGVAVPESNVIRDKPTAFVLMSDGCETHSFQCSKIDPASGRWFDPNVPFSNFFDPLVANLKSLHQQTGTDTDANEKWKNFIDTGTRGLKNEPDDKTMILGVLIKN